MPHDIPQSVEDVLDDNATFEPAALAAVRELARAKPWQGTDEERLAKLNACAAKLADAYGHEHWTFELGPVPRANPLNHVVTIHKLSVVTFLNYMAQLRGQNPFGAYRWSLNLFKRCFPRSFASAEQVGPNLVRREHPTV